MYIYFLIVGYCWYCM